ncbi:MAG: hypothetical protein B6D64_06830 [Bacteroidetes bacterium 4484_276]|nr:MAG: hypothetical protein B6D64_06830 [Bacteroidetes bacterium 4484_276]
MKYGVISYPGSINIGDEVQSVATVRLLPRVDYYLPREELNNPPVSEDVKLICNGWFMMKPKNWPPAKNIIPLFTSFHITNSNSSYKLLTQKKLIDYYKQFEPIGCRDMKTMEYFKKIGIKAYFSNCITLTLENQFTERNDDILLVDPLRYNYTKPYRDFFIDKMVPKKYHYNIKFVGQRRKVIDLSREERFAEAEKLIEMYSKAKMVITSRIHAALPCLALGTPVYFINAGYHSSLFNLNDRFEGIMDLFNVIGEDVFPYSSASVFHRAIRGLNLYKFSGSKPLPIDWENPGPNSDDYMKYTKLLKEKVKGFLLKT